MKSSRSITIQSNLVLILLVIFSFACTKTEKTPEDTLKEFVQYRFSSGQTKDDVLKWTDGLLKEQIESMSEEELKSFMDTSSFKKRDFKVNLSKCQESKCNITYTISYDQLKEDKKAYFVETKKIALLDKSSGEWKILDVNNVKTFLDMKEDIVP